MAEFHYMMIFCRVINRLLLRQFTAIADDDEVKDNGGYMGIKIEKTNHINHLLM